MIEARSFGVNFDLVRMRIDRGTGEVVDKSGETPGTWGDEVRADPQVTSLVRRYARRIAPLAGRVVGTAPAPLLRARNGALGTLGELAARAQRRLARADVAWVNGGNARADIPAGEVTYAEAFRASAYEHPVLRMAMRGRDVRRLLEQQFERNPDARLHSSGLNYLRRGDAVEDVTIGGRPLDPDKTYTVAANALLVEHGGFTAFAAARRVRPVGTDLEALVSLMRALDPRAER